MRGALLTGARYSELARMHVADFHRDSGTVLVRTSKAGKVRHIELTTEGLEFFQEITPGRTGTEFLFHRDGAAWGNASTAPARRSLPRCQGDPRPPHSTRCAHTYASLIVMNGVPLMVVARNLGHADTRMVEKHYGPSRYQLRARGDPCSKAPMWTRCSSLAPPIALRGRGPPL